MINYLTQAIVSDDVIELSTQEALIIPRLLPGTIIIPALAGLDAGERVPVSRFSFH
jgi:hypothetical protein